MPSLWRVTWPLFVSLSLSLALIFTDAFFLSRISDAAAAAAGAINPLLGTTITMFSAMSQAGASVAGRLMGARRDDELPLTYFAMFGFNLVAGCLVTALMLGLHGYIPGWLGLSGETASHARIYLAVMASGQVLKAVQLAYGNILNSRGQTRYVLIEAVATNVCNIGLNLAFRHQLWGLPKPTVGTVAGVTVFALGFGMLFTIAVVHGLFRIRFPLRPTFAELRRPLRSILQIGIPAASEPVSFQVMQVVINLLVISLGAAALAARTYVMSFITISTVLWSIALGIGTQIAIAHRIGAGKLDDADRELHRAMTYGIVGSLVISLGLFAFRRPLLGMLTDDPAVIGLAMPIFIVVVFVEIGRSVNIVVGGALRSSGDAKFAAIVGSSLMWGLGVPAAFLLGSRFGLGFGLLGVWVANALDESTRGIVNYRRWRTGSWRALSALAPRSVPPPSDEPASVGDLHAPRIEGEAR